MMQKMSKISQKGTGWDPHSGLNSGYVWARIVNECIVKVSNLSTLEELLGQETFWFFCYMSGGKENHDKTPHNQQKFRTFVFVLNFILFFIGFLN